VGGELEAVSFEWRMRQHARLKLDRATHLIGPFVEHPFQPRQVDAMVQLQRAPLQRVDDHQVQLRGADRLHHVGVGAMLQRGFAQLRVVDARDHHHRRVRPRCAQLLEQPVARFIWQPHIEQDKRVSTGFEQLPGLGRGEGDVGFEAPAAQSSHHDLGQRFLVIDDEQPPCFWNRVHAQQCKRLNSRLRGI